MIDRNKISGTRGSVVFFDKDRGGELLVRASGGTYLELRRGEPSGMAPFRGLKNTEADKDFLRGWLIALIQSDGKGTLNPEDEKKLETRYFSPVEHAGRIALARGPARIPAAIQTRWVSARGWKNGAGAEPLGWAFDGDQDNVSIDEAITGFDMTQLLEHDEVCAPAGAYLLYRVTQILDRPASGPFRRRVPLLFEKPAICRRGR